jgi:hypothetical protein
MDLTLPSTVDSCNHGSGILDLLVPFYVPLLGLVEIKTFHEKL